MKKLMALLLVLVLSLSFAACGSTGNTSDDGQQAGDNRRRRTIRRKTAPLQKSPLSLLCLPRLP